MNLKVIWLGWKYFPSFSLFFFFFITFIGPLLCHQININQFNLISQNNDWRKWLLLACKKGKRAKKYHLYRKYWILEFMFIAKINQLSNQLKDNWQTDWLRNTNTINLCIIAISFVYIYQPLTLQAQYYCSPWQQHLF